MGRHRYFALSVLYVLTDKPRNVNAESRSHPIGNSVWGTNCTLIAQFEDNSYKRYSDDTEIASNGDLKLEAIWKEECWVWWY